MFDENKSSEKFGRIVGGVVMYFVFTTILFFILRFLNKLPEKWNYFHVILITIFIVLLGSLIKMLLK